MKAVSLRMVAALAAASTMVFTTVANAAPAPDSFAPLVEKLLPAVVNISTSQKVEVPAAGTTFQFPGMPQGQQEQFKEFFEQFGNGMGGPDGQKPLTREAHSLGSGFIISADGYVVTNNHVIANAEEITVTLADDTKLDAKLVGRDPKTDVALLKVTHEAPLPFVNFGDSDAARVGDWVIAIGNPFGLGGTVSAGIISARSRNINAGPFDDFLQTDAAINRGNSGGPMFNILGEVIGVNTAIFSPTGGSVGIGFSVPTTLAKPVLDQLRKFGRTHRAWLGVKIQHVTEEVADSLGLDKAQGALVLGINEKGPAKKSGFHAGDIILSFDGKPVKEMRFLPRIVAETKIGKVVDVVVWRKGTKQTINVTLGELDEGPAAQKAKAKKTETPKETEEGEAMLGMMLKKLDSTLQKRLGLKDVAKGVVVLTVNRSSEAAKRGMRSGDVIVGVNQQDVASISELKAALKKAQQADRKYALIRVMRNGETSFVTLPSAE